MYATLFRRLFSMPTNDAFVYSESPSGLSMLSKIARNIRVSLRYQPGLYTSIPTTLGAIDAADLSNYFAGYELFVAILLVMAFFLIVVGIFNCAVNSFFTRHVFRKRERGDPSLYSRIVIKGGISVLTIILILAVIANYQSSRYITITGSDFQSTSLGVLQNLEIAGSNLTTSIDSAFIDVLVALRSVTQQAHTTPVGLANFVTAVGPSMKGYAASMQAVGIARNLSDTLLSKAIARQALVLQALNLVQSHSFDVQNSARIINSPFTLIPGSNNQYYAIPSDKWINYTVIYTDTSILSTYVGSFPMLDTAYSEFPHNTTGLAIEAQPLATNTSGVINEMISKSFDTFLASLSNTIITRKMNAISPIEDYLIAAREMLDQYTESITVAFTWITSFNIYRQLLQASLTALICLFFFMWWIEIFLSGGTYIRTQIIIGTLVFVPAILATIVYFVVTVLLVEGCDMTFAVSSPVIEKYFKVPIVTDNINALMILRHTCMNNGTILAVGIALGAISPEHADIDAIMVNSIPSSNTSLALNIDDFLPIAANPAIYFSNVLSFNTSILDTTYLSLAVTLVIPSFRNALLALRANVSGMRQNYTTDDLQYTIAATQTDKENALVDFKTKCATLITNIDSLAAPGWGLDILSTNVTAFSSDIQKLSSATTALQTHALITEKMASVIPASAETMNENIKCVNLAKQTYTMQDQLCGVELDDLDSTWLTMLIISLVVVLTIPLMMHATKTLLINWSEGDIDQGMGSTPQDLSKKQTISMKASNAIRPKKYNALDANSSLPDSSLRFAYMNDGTPETYEMPIIKPALIAKPPNDPNPSS
ncbi:hypothetical protein BASA62_000028 [Batrachochytrium salamandrivorans]|nr:hypothetical protein BASA62_000028 [Batrachochytrium salamandrivorans]